MPEEVFDFDAFIASVNADRTQSNGSNDVKGRLNRVLMNVRDNQGLLTMEPVRSKVTGNFYMKIPKVYEYKGNTSLLDTDDTVWFKILPIDFYSNLTPEQIEMYNEIKGYLDTLSDNESVDYSEFRVRNYNIFQGICKGIINSTNEHIDDYNDAACIFVYPSNSVIDAFGTAINNKIESMKGRKEWIPMVLGPTGTNRKGVMQIDFRKSAGPGYDSTVSFEFNSELNMVIDPTESIPEHMLDMYDDILPTFLGWIYDRDNKSYFNEVAFKELRDQLKLRVKNESNTEVNGNEQAPADSKETPVNKNGMPF